MCYEGSTDDQPLKLERYHTTSAEAGCTWQLKIRDEHWIILQRVERMKRRESSNRSRRSMASSDVMSRGEVYCAGANDERTKKQSRSKSQPVIYVAGSVSFCVASGLRGCAGSYPMLFTIPSPFVLPSRNSTRSPGARNSGL